MELVETTTLPYCINLNINVGIYYYYFVEITYSILWKFLMVHIHDENYLKIFVHAILKKHKKGFFFSGCSLYLRNNNMAAHILAIHTRWCIKNKYWLEDHSLWVHEMIILIIVWFSFCSPLYKRKNYCWIFAHFLWWKLKKLNLNRQFLYIQSFTQFGLKHYFKNDS